VAGNFEALCEPGHRIAVGEVGGDRLHVAPRGAQFSGHRFEARGIARDQYEVVSFFGELTSERGTNA
jgi:hypothetical protein